MKKKVGYLVILSMFSILLFLLSLIATEKNNLTSFGEYLEKNLPLSDIHLPQTSYIKDNTGQIISEVSLQGYRKNLTMDEIPPFLVDLFVLSEDKQFYQHIGFDLSAIGRAVLANAKADSIEQGASTITQQLARNIMGAYDKTYNRKVTELLYAYEIEKKFNKEEILTHYINAIYFANNVYGIDAAANFYFNSSINKLSDAQLVFLASIPNNPTMYDPLSNFDQTKKRQERLIQLLVDVNKISDEQAKELKEETITLRVHSKTDLYPDYVTYVEEELKELVAENKGYKEKLAKANKEQTKVLQKSLNNEVESLYISGIIIHTSMDQQLQKTVVSSVNDKLKAFDTEGAAVVIDQKYHQILALAGGKEYQKYDFNRSYQAFRQPGSAIKPLLVYGPYLQETKKSINTLVNADSFCKGNYCPSNYSWKSYGMVTMEQAFIHSYNTPAVRLLDKIGIHTAFDYLHPFSFQKVDEKDEHLSAAVGGFNTGITPLELTSAYTTFGNDGVYQPARAITSVTDLEGNLLFKWKDPSIEIWDKSTNDKLRQLLEQTVESGTAKQANFPASYLGGKTGTTNDYKDYWMVGLSKERTVGVWIGKDIPGNLHSLQSEALHLKIWKAITQAP